MYIYIPGFLETWNVNVPVSKALCITSVLNVSHK